MGALQLAVVLVLTVAPASGRTVGVAASNVSGAAVHHNDSHGAAHHGIHVANWRWEEIGLFFCFSAFIIITGLAKVVFHHVHYLSAHIPESCLMIIVGVTVGGIIYVSGVTIPSNEDDRVVPQSDVSEFAIPTFTPRLFFLVLLPPVILEAAYSLYDRAFACNLYTVLLYAVIGTLINTFTIGPILYGVSEIGIMGQMYLDPTPGSMAYALTLRDCLVFSALISAVDPVAVLAIFQEIGVNKDLYYLVFGESLFNDAVTVVLYTTMVTFSEMDVIPTEQYALATVAFFTVSLGGLTIGVIFGLLTALVTKTTREVRVVEPLAVLGIAYLSYLTAELFHFSGIISIIFCGLVQAHYALKNISQKSYTTVKYFTKMVSSTSDAVIFLFLGMVLVSDRHVWHTGFVLWTLLLCLVCRFFGVFLLTAVANIYRVKPINFQEQFLMAYGGLRGAVAFSLVEMLQRDTVEPRQVFVTTTLVVILFTVFVQGATIKPLVSLLHIKKLKEGCESLNEEISENIICTMMAGIEEITGSRGDFYIRRKLESIDEAYLKRIFINMGPENDLTRLFEKLSLTDHFAHLYGPVALVEDRKTDVLNRKISSTMPSPLLSPSSRATFRFSALFPGVELRRLSGSQEPQEPSDRDDSLRLRQAFRNNPYRRFHERYNRNLINDDCQELTTQLEERRLRARRITQMAALHNRQSAMSDLGHQSERSEQFSTPRRRIHSELEGVFPEEIEGISALLDRAEKRGSRMRSISNGESDAGVTNTTSWSITPVLQRQSQPTRDMQRLSQPIRDPLQGIAESDNDVFSGGQERRRSSDNSSD